MRAGNHGLYGPTRRDAAISGGLSANPKLPHDREQSKSWTRGEPTPGCSTSL